MTADYIQDIYWGKCYIKEFLYKGNTRYSILFDKDGSKRQELYVRVLAEAHLGIAKSQAFYCYDPMEVGKTLENPVTGVDIPGSMLAMRVLRRERFWNRFFFVRLWSCDEFKKQYPEAFI